MVRLSIVGFFWGFFTVPALYQTVSKDDFPDGETNHLVRQVT